MLKYTDSRLPECVVTSPQDGDKGRTKTPCYDQVLGTPNVQIEKAGPEMGLEHGWI